MNLSIKKIGLATALILLVACDKKDDQTVLAAPEVESSQEQLRNNPDFGGTTKVSREAEGIGSTPELAVIAALQSAAAQVNGVRVDSQIQSIRTGLNITIDGSDAGSASSNAFMQQVLAASNGTILGYEILSQTEIDKVDEEIINRVRASDGGYSYKASGSASVKYSESASGNVSANESASSNNKDNYSGSFNASANYKGDASYEEKGSVESNRGKSSYSSDASYKKMRSYWKVRVKADIAQYRAPEEKGKPKIIVSLPRTLSKSYPVGDTTVSSDEVARAVRARLSDMLTQTKRFIVLDREFGDEMQAEINHINSGNVRLEDSARIGQQLATDLILIPTIERFEYPKHVRQLKMSDRQVVSYSGGGRIALKLLNAATGEVVMSDSFDHSLSSTGPSTLPRVVDGKGMASTMMDSMSAQIGSAIVTEIFPISVVSLNGDKVILSQGGDSLSVGERWLAFSLGEELVDPQTGNSLGRTENPCCTIRIDRVSNLTSYGTIEEGSADLGGMVFKPGLIELREKSKVPNPVLVNSNKSNTTGQSVVVTPKKPSSSVSPKPSVKADSAPMPTQEDDNW